MTNGTRYWHYTTADRLSNILNDGYVRRARAGVPDEERRAVWFTSRDTWEPTATIGVTPLGEIRDATVAKMVQSGPLVRLAVDASVARYTWDHHRRFGRIDPREADVLELIACEEGSNPADWRISYRDVAVTQIQLIEASTDGLSWRPSEWTPCRQDRPAPVPTECETAVGGPYGPR